MWIFWALLSALLVASRRPLEKTIINKMHHFTYSFLTQCFSLPVLLAIVISNNKIINPFTLGIRFWLPVLIVSGGFYPINAYLYQQALKNSELSKVLPIQSLWPVLTLLLAWLTLKEVPGFFATIGVLAIVLGIYALNLKGKKLHHPLQPFREDKSSRAMLAGVFLVALVSILDKVAIEASNPMFYSLSTTIGAILTLSVGMRITKQSLRGHLNNNIKQLGAIGALQGTTYVTYLIAITMGPIAYVSALRSTNILMGSILGIILFKEHVNNAKITSYILIIIGSVILAIS